MALVNRLFQFLLIFFTFLLILFSMKYSLKISDYVIPGPDELLKEALEVFSSYISATLNTFMVALIGHFSSILLAILVAGLASLKSWAGRLAQTASFNLQAYPVVAVSPLIFIFFGDGMISRIIIASIISYFPLLLSFIGIFSTPVPEVEHFYTSTGRMTTTLAFKIRTAENMDKLITVIVGSSTLAMVGTIVAEFLAATNGIGYAIRKALYQNNLARILVSLFLIGLASSFYLACLEEMGKHVKHRIMGHRTGSR